MRIGLETLVLIIIAAAIGLAIYAQPPRPLARLPEFRVIDGDSLAIGDRRVRLLGFDTPESWRPRCPSEKLMAAMATLRMQMLTATPGSVLRPTGARDAFDRELARLMIGSEDAADIMIREGLAHAYRGGRREGWCVEK